MEKIYTYKSEVYFDELDGLGVLHHTRYLLHLERAQQKFFEKLLGVDDFDTSRDEDIYVVVHSVNSRFRTPFRQPGPLFVDYSIARIRSSGVTMNFKLRSEDGSVTYCDGERTVCKLSSQNHQPTPWTEPFRKAMEAYL
jgi:acyl-CoA thioester hydrolase